MVLPAFSGPDDTSVGISLLAFTLAYVGSETLLQEVDLLGLGKWRVTHTVLAIIFTFEISFSLFSFA